jgi:uncharacterized protein YecT (DUF1311 family)
MACIERAMRSFSYLAILLAVQLPPVLAIPQGDVDSLAAHEDAACDAAQRVPIPAADLPSPADRLRLAKCSPYELYDGDPKDTKGLTPNVVDARKCAFLRRDANSSATAAVSSSEDMDSDEPLDTLAMIYANGKGVPRNLDLALRFVCEEDPGAGLRSEQVRRLMRIEAESTPVDFDGLCEVAPRIDPRSVRCYRKDLIPKWQEYHRRFSAFTSGWSERERQALVVLADAEDKLFWLDRPEYDSPHNLDGQIEGGYESAESLLEALEQVAKHPPRFTLGEYKKADVELNATYRKALQAAHLNQADKEGLPASEYGEMKIRQAERAWLAYREAWVAFGAVKWPLVSADSWRAWLTLQRSEELKALVP